MNWVRTRYKRVCVRAHKQRASETAGVSTGWESQGSSTRTPTSAWRLRSSRAVRRWLNFRLLFAPLLGRLF